ncbi:MAG TPA: type II toxin-antitoxin system RelE/ParE family toxin [Candidatus Acidoferrum sp.]|nr:type II toxin-antitoxin system RelE/ParE family toxin [Candidatus Acidoferrum sp.]
MANKKVEFHEEADVELDAAFNWYLERSESAAAKFLADIDSAIANITETPDRWPAGIHGTRKFLLRRFPFAVVYREIPTSIQVVAVAHGYRRPAYWRKRL